MNRRIVSLMFPAALLVGSLFAQGNPPATRPGVAMAVSPSAAAPAQGPASPTAIVRPEAIKTVYVTVTGAKQGVLGKGKIRLLKFEFPLSRLRNPAGVPANTSGGAISVTKSWDAASAPLLQALANNETLNPVLFEFMAIGADGRESTAFTIKLTNATVVSITQSVDAGGPGATEEVHFTYQRLELQDILNRAGAEIVHEGSF